MTALLAKARVVVGEWGICGLCDGEMYGKRSGCNGTLNLKTTHVIGWLGLYSRMRVKALSVVSALRYATVLGTGCTADQFFMHFCS